MNRRLLCSIVGALAAGVVFAAESPNLTLANIYRDDIDVGDYYVSEKLDGVRAYWDGAQLRSRRGNVFVAPLWFVAGFPSVPLDGELWSRRGDFANISGIVRRHRAHDGWRQIRYMVFDMPTAAGDFRERLSLMQQTIAAAAVPHLRLVEQRQIADDEELYALMDKIVGGGGEGLMLRRKDSPYRGGRNDDLLKLKPYMDAEATVIAHYPGRGKFLGMLGSIGVETADGIRFKIGSGFSAAERQLPPPLGARITYRHSGFTNTGKPRFAVFLRVRDEEPQP